MAYGQVAPVVIVPVSAAEAGVMTGLQVRPGMHVRAGQSLEHMSGPAIDSVVVQQGEADVRSAQSQIDAARKSLDIARQQLLSHMTTRQAVQQAESAEAQARSGLVNAQSRLNAVRQLMTVHSPADGIVLQLNSADGALVSAGQPILTIQPANGRWLVANYYGADLEVIRVGMTGQFQPADGGVHTRPANIKCLLRLASAHLRTVVQFLPCGDIMHSSAKLANNFKNNDSRLSIGEEYSLIAKRVPRVGLWRLGASLLPGMPM